MCEDCGCDSANYDFFAKRVTGNKIPKKKILNLELDILSENKNLATQNQKFFNDHQILAINLMSSPGAGKTELLCQTIKDMGPFKIKVLTGDQQTDNDAQRLIKSSIYAKQITTHSSCHLDASMIKKELQSFVTKDLDILFIENVGNLVCPGAFDLGEQVKVALLSITEGEDKPEKYPVLFFKADIILLTKYDLYPHLKWDEQACLNSIKKVNPKAEVIKVSSQTGLGISKWIEAIYAFKEKKYVSGHPR